MKAETPKRRNAKTPKRRNGETGLPSAFILHPSSLVERAALLALLSLIPLRAVFSETHTFEVLRLFRGLAAPPSAQPATTLAIVCVIFCAAILTFVLRLWRGGPRYRPTGAELGAVLLLLAAVVSTWRAGQKHLALIGVVDFLGMVLYMLTLRQLLTRPWHLRLTLAVILGTGAVVVTKCGYQRWVEWPQTLAYYEEHKAELLEPAGAVPDATRQAGLLYDYEQRLKSGGVSGYFGHPNILASYLILVVFASMAVVSMRRGHRRAWARVVPALIGLSAVAAMFYSQSKGAVAACAAAIALWALGRRLASRGPSSQNATPTKRAALTPQASSLKPQATSLTRLWLSFWLAALVGAGTLVVTLRANPAALGSSMLYRSMYWQGAWDMLRDQGPWGVGANNFGRFFTRYKPVACPEDVESPHSWIAQAATEWGVLGLGGLLLLFGGVSRRLARPGPSAECTTDAEILRRSRRGLWHRRLGGGTTGGTPVPQAGCGRIVFWMAGIGVVVFGALAGLLRGCDPGFLRLSLFIAAAPWVFAFTAAALERGDATVFSDEAVGPMLGGVVAGLLGFGLHTGIDLAMFHPGAATTFFALMAVALAARSMPEEPKARAPRRGAAVVVTAIGLAGAALFAIRFVKPAASVSRNLGIARLNRQAASWDGFLASTGYHAYRDAIDCYPLDGTALDELADELITRVSTLENADPIRELLDELRRRDPAAAVAWHHRANLYYQRFELGGSPKDLERSISAMHEAVSAYPTSPTKRLRLAGLLEKLAETTGDAKTRQTAAAAFQAALDLDAQRVYVSQPNRLTPSQRSAIEARIKRLRHAAG